MSITRCTLPKNVSCPSRDVLFRRMCHVYPKVYSSPGVYSIYRKGGKSGKKKGKDGSIKSMSEANSKMWETRLELAERSRTEYRSVMTYIQCNFSKKHS